MRDSAFIDGLPDSLKLRGAFRPNLREHMATDVDLERLALCALCAGARNGPVKETLTPLLRGYQWRTQINQVIFDALSAIPSENPETIRDLLPAKLTRMGFPDVDWDHFFKLCPLSREESIELIQRMIAG